MSPHFASPSKGVDLRATNTRTSHQQHHIRAASTKLLPSFKKSQEANYPDFRVHPKAERNA